MQSPNPNHSIFQLNHFALDINLDISYTTSATLLASETRYQYIRCVAPSYRSAGELQLAVGLANGKVGLCNFVPSNENNIEFSESAARHRPPHRLTGVCFDLCSTETVTAVRMPCMARDGHPTACHRPRSKSLRSLHHRVGHWARCIEGECDATPDRPVGNGAFAVLGQKWSHPVRRHEPQVLENDGFAPEYADREHGEHARRPRCFDRAERTAHGQFHWQSNQFVGCAKLRQAHFDSSDREKYQRLKLVLDA